MSFIQNIHIKHIHHLNDLDIELDLETKKHLILTGKNGSGKTSVLTEIQKALICIERSGSVASNARPRVEYVLFNGDRLESLSLSVSQIQRTHQQYMQGEFILCFFKARRSSHLARVDGPKKITVADVHRFDHHANMNFMQYLVNLKTERSFARDDDDLATVTSIDAWFEHFEAQLRQLFSDPSLRLVFDRKNYNFYFEQDGHEPFGFSTLSDGYAAIMDIVTELMMRMHTGDQPIYEVEGIVLIDEIETHLHLALQKQVLPFLTALFPNIQFIVSTHSPFVLNSIADAVVYDLDYRERVHDLSAYSYDALVESYFDQDKYSEVLKDQVQAYATLVTQKNLNDVQQQEMAQLQHSLREKVNAPLAQEVQLQFKELEIQRVLNHGSD
ncbi:MAG: AAA family ATPase [Mariprofundaceae bacterium]|nr:AAA family ATPase [Mariprofundaceae bacterium]